MRGRQLRGELARQRGEDGRAEALRRAAELAGLLIGAPVAASDQVPGPVGSSAIVSSAILTTALCKYLPQHYVSTYHGTM